MDLPNKQRPEPPIKSDGKLLEVHSLFPTIQGEGPFSGRAAFFVRLAGCNLQCPLCDTQYTDNRTTVDVYLLAEEVGRRAQNLVVITGGEPFRQNIAEFCRELIQRYKKTVQIETNGKLEPMDIPTISDLVHRGNLHIVVSPKTSRISGTCAALATAFKYVLRHTEQDPDDLLPTKALGHALGTNARHVARPPRGWKGPIYVHPADEQDIEVNMKNLRAATEAVLQFPHQDRRVGLQVHKLVGLE